MFIGTLNPIPPLPYPYMVTVERASLIKQIDENENADKSEAAASKALGEW